MPPDPKSIQIADAMVTQLGGISVAGGYHFDVAEVTIGVDDFTKRRSKQPTLELQPFPASELGYFPDNVEASVLVTIWGFLDRIELEAAGVPVVTGQHRLIQDIIRALHDTPRLGLAWVIDTKTILWDTDHAFAVQKGWPRSCNVVAQVSYEHEFGGF